MLGNFLFHICGCKKSWTMKSFVRKSIEEIKAEVGDKRVILGLSGGVDSSVATALLYKAIGKQLTCVFVDNGLLRNNEGEKIRSLFRNHFKVNLRYVNARERFLKPLKGVIDPEKNENNW